MTDPTPDPTPACEQDAATIDDLHERIDRLEGRDGPMSVVEALARVLNPEAMQRARYQADVLEQAERVLADPGPLLAALAEAGVLHRQGKARIHYRYGVNSGTLTTTNSPTAIDLAVRNHEQLTMGPIDVERVEVGTQFTHLTEWRPADDQ